ncbi:LacI family DNA-binding transcriptional regulator [Arthrobacter sp. MMS24-S77]
MRDVAIAAGVSAQTVSRVLGGRPNVQESTRAKVLDAVKQLGYHRTNTARALVTGRSMTVGVLTLASGFYSRAALVLGIERAARQSGYTVNATTTESLDASAVSESLQQLIQQGVDGIIIAVPLLDADDSLEALTRVVPTLTLDGARTSSADVVAVNQTMAVRLATKHLLDLGHRTVWHVAGPMEWNDAATRVAGWRATLQEAGREIPPSFTATGPLNPATNAVSSLAAWQKLQPYWLRATKWPSASCVRSPSLVAGCLKTSPLSESMT